MLAAHYLWSAARKEKQQQPDDAQPVPVPQPAAEPATWRQRACTALAHHLHMVSFVPLAIITVLADVNLPLGAAINVGLMLGVLLLSYALKRGGYVRVWPKKFDIFNFQLYLTVLVLSLTAWRWLHTWLSVYTNGCNALFMWATIALPAWECFVMDTLMDRVPPALLLPASPARPILRRMALLVSLSWASALTVMAAASLVIPIAALRGAGPQQMRVIVIVCGYALGIGPIVVASIVGALIVRYHKRKLHLALAAAGAGGAGAVAPPSQQGSDSAASSASRGGLQEQLLSGKAADGEHGAAGAV